ncbi:MAG: RluA family pseudouridine synthase, partial [Clostridia bacterium]|nr:RluA family pseudouridine synthase [Clostridia bacterium]
LPVKMTLDIVYEDENIIAVNKSGDMPVHPSHNHHDDTLANGMAYYFMQLGIPFNFRAVNRLDRETSGLVIVAKNRMSANRFAKLLESRNIVKGYIAILSAVPERKKDRIVTHIKREQESIIKRCNCPEDQGDIAITDYEVIDEGNGLCLVRAYPITGRTHQLRVHFSGIGCPILGDSLYGEASEEISRQALHGHSLEFDNPFKGERVRITDQLHDDMKRIIKEKMKIDL